MIYDSGTPSSVGGGNGRGTKEEMEDMVGETSGTMGGVVVLEEHVGSPGEQPQHSGRVELASGYLS